MFTIRINIIEYAIKNKLEQKIKTIKYLSSIL